MFFLTVLISVGKYIIVYFFIVCFPTQQLCVAELLWKAGTLSVALSVIFLALRTLQALHGHSEFNE